MEEFNLDTWLQDKSRKVVTRDGRPVRIVCWDRQSSDDNRCIIGLVDNGIREDIMSFDKLGHYSTYSEGFCDLFFADEEEKLSDFELRLLSSLDYTRKFRQNFSNEHMLKTTKDIAKELLDLARKEIFKDLPKYKKAEESKVLDWVVKLTEDGNIIFSDVVYKGEYFIMLQSLKVLPKEE